MQAFELAIKLMLLQLCTYKERVHLLFMAPNYIEGALHEACCDWHAVLGQQTEAWLAAASRAGCRLPQLHAVGSALATPYVQAAIRDWAAGCRSLTEPLITESLSSELCDVYAAQVHTPACCKADHHAHCRHLRH